MVSVIMTAALLMGVLGASNLAALLVSGAPAWTSGTNVSAVTGDETDGYSFSGTQADPLSPSNIFASCDQGYNLNQTRLELDFDSETGTWGYISMYAGTPTAQYKPDYMPMYTAKEIILFLDVVNVSGEKKLALSKWDYSSDYMTFGKIPLHEEAYLPIEFDGVHSLEIVLFAGNYYISIDGIVLTKENVNTVFSVNTTASYKFRFGGNGNFAYDKVAFVPKNADWIASANGAVTENTDGTFSLLGRPGTGGVAVYQTPSDLGLTSLQFKGGIDSTGASWSYISAAATSAWSTSSKTTYTDNVHLRLTYAGTTLTVTYFDGTAHTVATVADYDLTALHKIGFVYNKTGSKWCLNIDGTLYDNEAMSNKLKTLNTATMYYRIGAGDTGADKAFSSIDVVQTGVNEAYKWQSHGMTVEGNGENGFNLSGGGAIAFYNTPFEIENHQVSLKLTPSPDSGWGYLALCTDTDHFGFLQSPDVGGGRKAIEFFLQQSGTSLRVGCWINNTDVLMLQIDNFDFTASHTYAFREIDGKWHLSVDDTVSPVDISDYVDFALTEAYLCLGFQIPGAAMMTGVFFEDKEDLPDPAVSEWMTQSLTETQNPDGTYSFIGSGSALRTVPADLISSTLTMQIKPAVGQWVYMSVTTSPAIQPKFLSLAEALKYSAMEFILGRENETTLRISVWNNDGGGELALAYIHDFNFDIPHTYTLQQFNDEWNMTIDGEKCAQRTLTDKATGLQGKTAYLTLAGDQGNSTQFNKVKITQKQTVEPVKEYWRADGVKISGQPQAGFSITGHGTAIYLEKFDIRTQELAMQFLPSANEWAQLAFADTIERVKAVGGPDKLFNKEEQAAHNTLEFILSIRNNNTLLVSRWNDETASEQVLLLLKDFDPTVVHTYGFGLLNGKWYLSVDGKIHDNIDMTEHIERVLKRDTYLRIGSSGAGTVSMNGVKVQNKPVYTEAYDWSLEPGVYVSGDNKKGYELTGNGMGVYKHPFDIRTDKVTFRMKPERNSWVYMSLSSPRTPINIFLSPEDIKRYSAVEFIMGQEDNGNLRFSIWDNQKSVESAVAYVMNFDWDKAHTFSFFTWNNYWYMTIDNTTFARTKITEEAKRMLDTDVYLRLGSDRTKETTFSNISFDILKSPADSPSTGDALPVPSLLIFAASSFTLCLLGMETVRRKRRVYRIRKAVTK